jgi:hypothetical protein
MTKKDTRNGAKLTVPKSGGAFRLSALRKNLTDEIGAYAICDLDGVPIYVGKSHDGIRSRVYRHLTSARSDIIANRLVDVWEIAYVQAWPVAKPEDVVKTEAMLFRYFDARKPLMNGSIPAWEGAPPKSIPPCSQMVQVMSDEDIKIRREPVLRLPRQIEHIGRLVDHLLTVKDKPQLRRALAAHFDRLDAYRNEFLKQGKTVVRKAGESDDEDDDAE